ncbi:MAG: FAD-dependent oxidoreductase [Promethearchaeota archaeon]
MKIMKIIVIGGNPAGLSAASAIRKGHPDWDINVYEKGQYISYGSCGIPYYVADEVKSLDNLMTLTPEILEKKRNIPVHLFHEVTKVDFAMHHVKIKNLKDNSEFEKQYDYLVIAVGGKSNTVKIEIDDELLDHPRVFRAHTLVHAEKLKKFLNTSEMKNVVVIGSGYIGLEMLEAYEAHGIKDITLIGPRLNFRSKSQEFVQKELDKHQIKVILTKRAKKIEKIPDSDTQLKVLLDDGSELITDAVQLSIGVLPATNMFQDSNLEMLPNGAIVIDEYCRTNIDKVYSAGDCATSYHNILKKNVYIPLAPTANKQGRIAGEHIGGKTVDTFQGVIGTAIFKIFDLYCAKTGITEAEARDLGFNVATTMITNNEIAHYYPNAQKMSVLLVFDTESHLLLGAEITAPSPLGAKKIDVLATALAAKMTIKDIQKLDLSYAPPFASVWDPILIAANIARKKLK